VILYLQAKGDMEQTSNKTIDQDEHLTHDAAIAKVRQLLSGFQAAMFITQAVDGAGLHIRPMGLQGDPSVFGGTLWFFADDRSRKVREIEREPRATLVFQDDETSRYLQLNGSATSVRDRNKMRELYTPRVQTWFPDGLDDPHLMLIRFDATSGSFWDSPGGMLQVMAAFTKAVVTGTPARSGRAGTMDL